MPTPAAPRVPHRNSPNPVQSTIAAVITVLVLLGLAGQCGSTAETSDSAPVTSVPTTPPTPLDEPLQPASDEVTVIDDITPPPLSTPAPAMDYSDDSGTDDTDTDTDTDTDDSNGFAYYKNCSAARAAGAAPLYASDPGYSSDLDRDGDGVACES